MDNSFQNELLLLNRVENIEQFRPLSKWFQMSFAAGVSNQTGGIGRWDTEVFPASNKESEKPHVSENKGT